MTHNTEHTIIRKVKAAAAYLAKTNVSAGWLIVPFILGALLF